MSAHRILTDLELADLPLPDASREMAKSITAASAVITNTAAETIFDKSITIKGDTLKVGDILDIDAGFITPDAGGTQQMTGRLRLGGLTGTLLGNTGPVTVTSNDIGMFKMQLTVRAQGASGKVVGLGLHALGDPDVTAKVTKLAEQTVNTKADQVIVVTQQWNAVTGATHSSRLDQLNFVLRRP